MILIHETPNFSWAPDFCRLHQYTTGIQTYSFLNWTHYCALWICFSCLQSLWMAQAQSSKSMWSSCISSHLLLSKLKPSIFRYQWSSHTSHSFLFLCTELSASMFFHTCLVLYIQQPLSYIPSCLPFKTQLSIYPYKKNFLVLPRLDYETPTLTPYYL